MKEAEIQERMKALEKIKQTVCVIVYHLCNLMASPRFRGGGGGWGGGAQPGPGISPFRS